MAKIVHLSPRPVLSPGVAACPAGILLTGASVALGLLSISKVPTWAGLGPDLAGAAEHVRLTPWQARCITEAGGLLGVLAVPGRGQGATATVAVCTTCAMWMAVSDASVSSKCTLGVGCEGKLIKAGAAVARKAPALAKTGT